MSVGSIEARQDKPQIWWHTFVWSLLYTISFIIITIVIFIIIFTIIFILLSVKNTLWFSCQLSSKLSVDHLNFHHPVSIFTILLESGVKRRDNQIVKIPTAPPSFLSSISSSNYFQIFAPRAKMPQITDCVLAYHMAMQVWLVLFCFSFCRRIFARLSTHFCRIFSSRQKPRPPTIPTLYGTTHTTSTFSPCWCLRNIYIFCTSTNETYWSHQLHQFSVDRCDNMASYIKEHLRKQWLRWYVKYLMNIPLKKPTSGLQSLNMLSTYVRTGLAATRQWVERFYAPF